MERQRGERYGRAEGVMGEMEGMAVAGDGAGGEQEDR